MIWWLRERCGKSEEFQSVTKSDLAGGQMPFGQFGANAAWRAFVILAHKLNAAMKQLARGKDRAMKQMKALPGRVVSRAQTDQPSGWRRRCTEPVHRRALNHPGSGMRTGRMTRHGLIHHAAGRLARRLTGPWRGPTFVHRAPDSRRLHAIPPGLAGCAVRHNKTENAMPVPV